MNTGLNTGNPTLHAAFMTALLHQGTIVLLIFAVLTIAWVAMREARPVRAGWPGASVPEPSWRAALRIGFGILWIVDGILQAQPAMVLGLPSQVIQPEAASSPGWVREVVNWGGSAWTYHPVQAAAAAVWIQVGIGIWLLAARRGPLSRLAGLASVGWGLVVWVFGEAFGGIFAPGLTWLFGAPGGVACYCVAGALIALPERRWHRQRVGALTLAVSGIFFLGMAMLQAWPGRGFWQGSLHHQPGTLTDMIKSMARVQQPRLLAGWVTSFSGLVQAHGFAVNLFVVVALALIGAGLLSALAGPRAHALIRVTVIVATVLCLADWVLIEDIGVFGGLGTDPNSMIPMALILVAGYLALRVKPAAAVSQAASEQAVPVDAAAAIQPGSAVPADAAVQTDAGQPDAVQTEGAETAEDAVQLEADQGAVHRLPVPAGAAAAPAVARTSASQRLPGRISRVLGRADARAVIAVWAVAITVLGAFPMTAAAASRRASPVIAQALNGTAASYDFPAPQFTLTSQDGAPVSLASLRGKVVLLTFLDPVCTVDCPLIAQEFRQADRLLGAARRHRVELVAVVTNPLYRTPQYTRAFDRQEGMAGLPNWLYLTGSVSALHKVWHDYGISAEVVPAGGMILHQDSAYVIDAAGHTRFELNMDPGPGTASTQSSFAGVLASAAERVLKQP
jgi:cytochrome oxidase Cu insertion factor (SCO1/SenC/PrrC family)